jgi:phage terminase large subunit-like protein
MQKKKLRLKLEASQTLFTKFFFRVRGEQFVKAEHHERIEAVLDKLERGELYNEHGEKCTIVVINIAPRFGKTQFISIDWPAKCIGKNPAAKFIHLSYSDELALDNSQKCKETVSSDEFQDHWPAVTIRQDTDSKKKWYTTKGGGMYATAAGGQVTGFGAGSLSDLGLDEEDEDEFEGFFAGAEQQEMNPDLFYGAIVIDDPIKVDDAYSLIARERANNRLVGTIMSRRNSRNTPIVVVMQRLHPDDMSGFILDGKCGEPVYHLNLQSLIELEDKTHLDIADPERYRSLWPEKHSVKELLTMRRTSRRDFMAQHQQDPSPDEGTFFEVSKIKRFRLGEEPIHIVKYGAGDFAVTEDDGDWTELGVAGFDHKDDLWFVDWWSGQVRLDKGVSAMFDLHGDQDPVLWSAEKGVIRRAMEGYVEMNQRRRDMYFKIEWLPSNKSKAVNAKAFQALVEAGKVHVPYGEWGDALIDQLAKFTGHEDKVDDKVDVCGILGRLLGQAFGPGIYHEQINLKEDIDDYGYDYEDDGYGNGNIPIV